VPAPPLSYAVLSLSHAATAAAPTRRLLAPPLAVQRRRSLLPSCVAERDKEGRQRLCILDSRRSRAELRFWAPPRAIQNGSGSQSAPPEEPFCEEVFGGAPARAGAGALAGALPNRCLNPSEFLEPSSSTGLTPLSEVGAMDLDPEGIFRDDSDEDEDNVQVRTGS